MTKKAKKFLLELQANAAADCNAGARERHNVFRASLFMAIQDVIETGQPPKEGRALKYFQDLAVKLGCGPLEDICAYVVLMNNVKAIKAAVEEVYKKNLRPLPTFGTLPHGDMNARTLLVPGTTEDFVVVLQKGLFDFLFSLTETFTAILPFQENGNLVFPLNEAGNRLDKKLLTEMVRRRIKEKFFQQENDKTILQFIEALTVYLSYGDLDLVTIWFGRDHLKFKSYLVKSSIQFVIAHELGHIYEGHLSTSKREVLALSGKDVENIAPDWNDEHVADFEGFWIGDAALSASREHKKRSNGVTWGSELVFCACELVERAYSGLEFGEGGHRISISHPPPQLRRETLRSNIRNAFMEEEHCDDIKVDMLLGPGYLLEIVAAELWKTVEDLFLNLHNEGHRPATIWRKSAH